MTILRDIFKQTRKHDREIRALKARGISVVSTSGGGGTPGSPLGVSVWENQSGASRSKGYVVVASGDRLFDDTTTVGDLEVIGVLDDDGVAAGSNGRVRHIGYQGTVNVVGAVTAFHYLRASATAGSAESAGASPVAGAFGIALEAIGGSGQIAAYLFPPLTAPGAVGFASFYVPMGSEALNGHTFSP